MVNETCMEIFMRAPAKGWVGGDSHSQGSEPWEESNPVALDDFGFAVRSRMAAADLAA